jgi:hypothetical protein
MKHILSDMHKNNAYYITKTHSELKVYWWYKFMPSLPKNLRNIWERLTFYLSLNIKKKPSLFCKIPYQVTINALNIINILSILFWPDFHILQIEAQFYSNKLMSIILIVYKCFKVQFWCYILPHVVCILFRFWVNAVLCWR